MAKKLLPPKNDNLSEWYTSLIQLADLADYGPAKGTMIIKPYGYAIWEFIQKELDREIKAKGIENAYFPLLIPISLLDKESSHVEGFSPELAVVTTGGGEKLQEPLVIRPTSETIMYHAYARWIHSWRDLPLMMNQWNNAVRWEKRTMPFMRTSEFLWQEGHTAHANHDEAIEIQTWAMDMYASTYRNLFAMDGYIGFKSNSERFAGANKTLTYETLMPSGKALQACTSHDLGQNFSKAFNIAFQDEEGGMEYVWQTSWGFSTRSIGGLIIAHGDDNGLKLPPRIAPVQVVIIPAKLTDDVLDYCSSLEEQLKKIGIRTLLDKSDQSFGFKVNSWEVKGAPVVFKVGPKEIDNNQITIQRRDTLLNETIPLGVMGDKTISLLEEIQTDMLESSRRFQKENTRTADSYEEFKTLLNEHKGFIKVFWNDNEKIEKIIKDETKATTRCLIDEKAKGKDFYTGEPSSTIWLFAQSY